MDMRMVEFIDEELQPHFGQLITLVREVERAGGVECDVVSTMDAGRLERIAKDFAQVHRQALSGMSCATGENDYVDSMNVRTPNADINSATLQSFSNFNRGTQILHTLLSELYTAYRVFIECWERRFPSNVRVNVTPIPVSQLVAEIKKYRSQF